VILTRTSDVNVNLSQRANIANKENADIFISVHCNAVTNSFAHGLETFYYPNSDTGRKLANIILNQLILETGLKNRGTKEANFAVLRLTTMPAVLVECGFLSNPAEEALLKQESFQKKCALGIGKGILAYLGLDLPEKGFENIALWAKESVKKAVQKGLVKNPELLNETEQKIIVWFDRLNLL